MAIVAPYWLSAVAGENADRLKYWFPALREAGLTHPRSLATLETAGTLMPTLEFLGIDSDAAGQLGRSAVLAVEKMRTRDGTCCEETRVESEDGRLEDVVELWHAEDPEDFLGAFESDEEDKETYGHEVLGGAQGEVLCASWLNAVRPLYRMHMGVENMGLMLYSLVRFLKPKLVLEVGAGYTSMFVLQALADNATEVERYLRERGKSGGMLCDGRSWCNEAFFSSLEGGASRAAQVLRGRLLTIDNMEHAQTSAHEVKRKARALDIDKFLELHECDAYDSDLPSKLAPGEEFDVIWIDLGAADRIGGFFDRWWPRVADGGYVLIHSSLTNRLTREWIDSRRFPTHKDSASTVGEMEAQQVLSFLEPHKLFQNAFTCFQKRERYEEPIHTRYP